ncbi:hypothetical protein BS47DRAFT_963123 [Hydnum rufescens UP504]|uniref:Uncharacterized protein n=1 Tax=Hydnum rufescens UP504 TaxID=1448309 RepID=A0A9P6DTS4_9AGAM|nr:hypothetical protein BS47DRAFT_963123 [Hydnum rufescens UP504]
MAGPSTGESYPTSTGCLRTVLLSLIHGASCDLATPTAFQRNIFACFPAAGLIAGDRLVRKVSPGAWGSEGCDCIMRLTLSLSFPPR